MDVLFSMAQELTHSHFVLTDCIYEVLDNGMATAAPPRTSWQPTRLRLRQLNGEGLELEANQHLSRVDIMR